MLDVSFSSLPDLLMIGPLIFYRDGVALSTNSVLNKNNPSIQTFISFLTFEKKYRALNKDNYNHRQPNEFLYRLYEAHPDLNLKEVLKQTFEQSLLACPPELTVQDYHLQVYKKFAVYLYNLFQLRKIGLSVSDYHLIQKYNNYIYYGFVDVGTSREEKLLNYHLELRTTVNKGVNSEYKTRDEHLKFPSITRNEITEQTFITIMESDDGNDFMSAIMLREPNIKAFFTSLCFELMKSCECMNLPYPSEEFL